MASYIFINRFFWPDTSATSQLLSDLAFDLAASGHKIIVITSRHLYNNEQCVLLVSEEHKGVKVLRIATTNFGRKHNLGRLIDYLSFYVSTLLIVISVVHRGDVLIAKTDPPLLSIPLAALSRIKAFHLVNWIQDLFPEVAASAGMGVLSGGFGRLVTRVRDWSLRRAKANITIGEDMRRLLITRGIPSETLHVVYNWGHDSPAVTTPSAGLRSQWGLENNFVAMYSGNLGVAHDHLTLLGAMEALHEDDSIRFLFVGGGSKLTALQVQAHRLGLTNFVVKPLQPRELLAESLAVGDIHLMSLQPAFDGQIVPSKYYGVLSAARPLVFIGSWDNSIAQEIRGEGLGATVLEGEVDALVEALLKARDHPELCIEQGKRAHAIFEARYTRSLSLSRWSELLNHIAT